MFQKSVQSSDVIIYTSVSSPQTQLFMRNFHATGFYVRQALYKILLRLLISKIFYTL